jgi:protein-L-isoaspartate(D-aspartate) O-methyltransferase
MLFRHQPGPEWQAARAGMMAALRRYGMRDERILSAMERVPRHEFLRDAGGDPETAYGDHPVRIGHGQTISQPYIVAYMIDSLALSGGERVLEVGSGCGYLLAILCELGAEAYGVERVADLSERSRLTLQRLGYAAHLRVGDGFDGWPGEAPFDAIVVSCAPPDVPPVLVEQLKPDGGRMILPVGGELQRLVKVRREGGETTVIDDLPVRFVPMVR